MAREPRFGAGKAQRLRRGLASLREGRFEEAIAELEPLARRGQAPPPNALRHLADAHRQAGLAHFRAGRNGQAEAHLRRAAELQGPRPDVQDALAEIYARTGRFDRCAEELQLALPGRQGDAAAWRKLAQAQWRAGRRAEAHMTLDNAVRRVGERADVRLQEGFFYSAEGLLNEARRAYALAVEADPDSAEAHYYLGLSAAAAGNHREAVESLQRAAELGFPQELLVYQLALAARAARQAGIDVPVRLSSLRGGAAGRDDAAPSAELIAATLKSYEGRPGTALSTGDRGQLESLLGAMGRALAAEDRSTMNSPPSARVELHGYCAEALDLLGKADEALPHARQAAELAEGAVPLVRLGKLCAKLGRREEAAGHLEAAVKKGADWADVHALLAELLLELGHRAQARSHLELALKRNANLRLAEGLRARLAA
jgi:tetratricopeptide (TPR) repeat protein